MRSLLTIFLCLLCAAALAGPPYDTNNLNAPLVDEYGVHAWPTNETTQSITYTNYSGGGWSETLGNAFPFAYTNLGTASSFVLHTNAHFTILDQYGTLWRTGTNGVLDILQSNGVDVLISNGNLTISSNGASWGTITASNFVGNFGLAGYVPTNVYIYGTNWLYTNTLAQYQYGTNWARTNEQRILNATNAALTNDVYNATNALGSMAFQPTNNGWVNTNGATANGQFAMFTNVSPGYVWASQANGGAASATNTWNLTGNTIVSGQPVLGTLNNTQLVLVQDGVTVMTYYTQGGGSDVQIAAGGNTVSLGSSDSNSAVLSGINNLVASKGGSDVFDNRGLVIAGGDSNTNQSTGFGFIGTGWNNQLESFPFETVLNGSSNVVNSVAYGQVLDGSMNAIGSHLGMGIGASTILDGYTNTVSFGSFDLIGGGSNNLILSANDSQIFDGVNNKMIGAGNTSLYNDVMNGYGNSETLFIGGILQNSDIFNGSGNAISANAGIVAYDSILNGSGNTIFNSSFSSIMGGQTNLIGGAMNSSVLWGSFNTIGSISNSVAGGYYANPANNYTLVFSDEPVSTVTNSSALLFYTNGVGINTVNSQCYALNVGGSVNFTGNLYQNGFLFTGGANGAAYIASSNGFGTNTTFTGLSAQDIGDSGNIDANSYTLNGQLLNFSQYTNNTITTLYVTNCTGFATNYNGFYTQSGGGWYTNNVSNWAVVPKGYSIYAYPIMVTNFTSANSNSMFAGGSQYWPVFGKSMSPKTFLGNYTTQFGFPVIGCTPNVSAGAVVSTFTGIVNATGGNVMTNGPLNVIYGNISSNYPTYYMTNLSPYRAEWFFSVVFTNASGGDFPSVLVKRPGIYTNQISELVNINLSVSTNCYELWVNPNTTNSITDTSGASCSAGVTDSHLEQ